MKFGVGFVWYYCIVEAFFMNGQVSAIRGGFVKLVFVFVNQTQTSTLAQRRPKAIVDLFCLQKKLDSKFEMQDT